MPAAAEWQLQKIRELLEASDVWDDAERTLAFPIFDSVAPSDMAALLSAAGIDLFGAWVQLVADIGTGKRLFLAVIGSTGTTRIETEYEFGEGSIGNEVAVARVAQVREMNVSGHIIPVFVALTDNARLSVRVRDDNAGAQNHVAAALIGPSS